MLTIEEINRVYLKYDGRNIWVRTKNEDSSRHRGRAKVIDFRQGYVEIQPENHKKTELVSPSSLVWWRAKMNQFHPGWESEKIDGPFYIYGTSGFWTGKDFSAETVKEAKEYISKHAVNVALSKVKKKDRSANILNKSHAIIIEQQIWQSKPTQIKNEAPVVSSEVEELQVAWQLFVESGNNLMNKIVTLLNKPL